MIWLVWRRQRAALVVALGVVVLVAVLLVVGRIVTPVAAAAAGVGDCLRMTDPGCQGRAWNEFRDGYRGFEIVSRLALLLTPAVAGIAAGNGLFGRELERETHLFALTQSVGRLRWWATGLLVAGVPVAVAVTLLTGVRAWAVAPFPGLGFTSPLQVTAFELTGIVPSAYTVLAFSLAATAGLWLRNVLAAIVLAFVLQLALQLGLSFGLREHYLPPQTDRFSLDSNVVGVPDGSLYLETGYLDAAGREINTVNVLSSDGCNATTSGQYDACLRDSGVVGRFARYQPASRYWPFQGIETGIVLVLVAGALGVGARGLRTRVH